MIWLLLRSLLFRRNPVPTSWAASLQARMAPYAAALELDAGVALDALTGELGVVAGNSNMDLPAARVVELCASPRVAGAFPTRVGDPQLWPVFARRVSELAGVRGVHLFAVEEPIGEATWTWNPKKPDLADVRTLMPNDAERYFAAVGRKKAPLDLLAARLGLPGREALTRAL